MILIRRSEADPAWVEICSPTEVLQEVEVRFVLRRFPKRFDSVELAIQWIQEMERKLAKNKAYRLLSMRSYPSKVLLKKLMEKGYSKEVCEELVDQLQKLGCVQDAEWSIDLIEREFQKGYGPRYIEMKLKSKGLDASGVRSHISVSMQEKKVREIISKEKKGVDRQKIIQKLGRKGFDLEIIIEMFS